MQFKIILFWRLLWLRLYGDGSQHGVRGSARRLRELHVEIILELFWHLIVAGEREAADELVVGVGTLAVLGQSGNAPHNRLGRDRNRLDTRLPDLLLLDYAFHQHCETVLTLCWCSYLAVPDEVSMSS